MAKAEKSLRDDVFEKVLSDMIGIIADDVTGANDIGIMFAKHNYKTEVYSNYRTLAPASDLDCLILNTESRYDEPGVAYGKVREATRLLKKFGATVFWKKSCSVFRGPVGAEFDAMLDELGVEFAVTVAGFPKNGRVTREGVHYVHGRILSDSEFARDPVNPTREPDLTKVLAATSRRKIGLLPWPVVKAGVAAVKEALAQRRNEVGYLLFDVLDQEDLATIAEATSSEKIFCGSSGLAEELPRFWTARAPFDPLIGFADNPGQGVLVVAGSVTPQARAQIAHAEKAGLPAFSIDTLGLWEKERAEAVVASAVDWAAGRLARGENVVIRATNEPEQVAATKLAGSAHGLSEVETSKTVSATLAEICCRITDAVDLKKLMVAGGDTAEKICGRLGIDGNLVLAEIEPGLASGLSRGGREMLLVLKSGSFGTPEFFLKAIEHLKHLTKPAD